MNVQTVIKAGESGPLLPQLSTVDLADHLAEGRAVVTSAKRASARIMEEAKRESARMFDEAKRNGYADGYRKGHVEGTKAGHEAAFQAAMKGFASEQGNLVADLQRAIEEIDKIKGDLRIEAERDLLNFAIDCAGKLTFAIGKVHRESAVENLRRALRVVGEKTDLTIHVHPADLESMKVFADSVLRSAAASPVVSIVADDSLSPGGCLVQTGRTRVDATLETQVDEMVALLLGGKISDV